MITGSWEDRQVFPQPPLLLQNTASSLPWPLGPEPGPLSSSCGGLSLLQPWSQGLLVLLFASGHCDDILTLLGCAPMQV